MPTRLIKIPGIHIPDIDIRVHQSTVVAVVLALAAATCFGVSSALQHRSSNQEADRTPLDPRLVLKLAKRPLWLLGGVADLGGVAFQALALGKGSLVLVEPLLCAAILVATPLGAFLDHRRLSRPQVVTLSTIVVSLGAFLVVARPNEGLATLRPNLVYVACAASAGLIGACLLAASRAPSPSRSRGALVALAAGVALGTSSALIKSVVTLFGRHGLGVVAQPATYGLVVLGFAGLVLTQNAFQAGPLGPALAILMVVEPVIGVAVGLAGLRERIATGPLPLILEILTAAITSTAIVVLCLRGDRAEPGGWAPRSVPNSWPDALPDALMDGITSFEKGVGAVDGARAPDDWDAPGTFDELSVEECWELLATEPVGRLGVIVREYPLVFPVNYALDGRCVVFRTAPGAKLWALSHSKVSFEVDHIDPAERSGWSVLVEGAAHEVVAEAHPNLAARSRAGGAVPWASGARSHLVRVVAHQVSGRRIRPGGLFPAVDLSGG